MAYKFHASLNNYMTDVYRDLRSADDVRRWMEILVNPPKDTIRNKIIIKSAASKVHDIYPDFDVSARVWYPGLLLDWIVLSAAPGEKEVIQRDDRMIFGRRGPDGRFVAESMSALDDILSFKHSDMLLRLAELGFETPDIAEHFEDIPAAINFLGTLHGEYLILVDYLYYRECIGYSTKYPMWGVSFHVS